MSGFTDKPTNTIKEDSFGIQQYVSGLNEFILECNTPMTIAIQGDWGSGKTSMMNMIKEKLGASVITTWFNTWQYSQFNMGDALVVSFLSRLLSDIQTNDDKNNVNIKKTLKLISRFAKIAAVVAADALVGGEAADIAKKGAEAFENHEEIDMPQAINELKKQFQTLQI